MLSPVGHEGNSSLPVINRLLNIPHLRARYLAHVRTIVNQWLDWRMIGPIVEEYRTLIANEVRADDKKLYDDDAFIASVAEDTSGYGRFSTPSLKRFIKERRDFLLTHPEIDKQIPQILSAK